VSAKPIKLRKVWIINPSSRVKESKKKYSRSKIKQEIKKAITNE